MSNDDFVTYIRVGAGQRSCQRPSVPALAGDWRNEHRVPPPHGSHLQHWIGARALTVTDIGRSKAFYDQVFGWPTAVDASGHADEPGVRESREQFCGGVVYETPQGTLFGLRPVGSSTFDPGATGLDHVSFAVESRTAL